MPVKQKSKMDKEREKKKKLKQKQKQRQVVKTSVKVNVQSSGGSGGGGSSMPSAYPTPIPQPFMDRNGENVRLHNLIQQIERKIQVPVMASAQEPILQEVPAPIYNPANDKETLQDVFKAPINYKEPIKTGGVSKSASLEEIAKRYTVPPIDVSNVSDEERRAILSAQFAGEQEFIIQSKRRGRKPGSKNKPKGDIGGGAAPE